MSDLDVADAVVRPARRRRARAVGAVAAVVVAVLVATTVWFLHWRSRSPLHDLEAFPSFGFDTPAPIGAPMYFDGFLVDSEEFSGRSPIDLRLDLTSVLPVVSENASHAADIQVMSCTLRSAIQAASLLGASQAQADGACSRIVPFHAGPATIGHLGGATDILIRVVPRRAGTVRIDGVDVRYRSGSRHGTQHVGGRITCQIPAA